MEKPLNVVFIGVSGSGKGTQVELLVGVLNLRQKTKIISSGDLFRDLQEHDTDTAHRVREILQKGGLPYDDLATALWMHEIAYTVKEDEGIVFDGAPRRVQEAKNIDSFFTFLDRLDMLRILHLNASPEEVTRRLLKRGRVDDNEPAIAGRIAYFKEKVLPATLYYQEQNRLIEINGEQSVEKVHKDIVKALKL
ncbi:MAG: adenylate kinase [Parcubacteria group bacterium Gr01-1014_29]|nr:MAG: adenylate kinase [Parcubacteria group bacterium Gr01-1014_29]